MSFMEKTTRIEKPANFSRRALLKAGGALVVSIGAPVTFDFAHADDAAGTAAMTVSVKPALTPDQLSSYIAVNADGTIAAYFGKMDMGHGIAVAIAQMVAEELDAPFASVKMFMGDTATSVNQGGASGSTGVQDGGKQLRFAAAEARRVLVEMAADKLGIPADQLQVTDAVVSTKNDAAQ
ncbi:MAG: molybdopterin cofactor-binding domain-containing protein, partial [Xanthobacteraceae bacterium]